MGLTTAKKRGHLPVYSLSVAWGEERSRQGRQTGIPALSAPRMGPHDKQTDNRMYIYTRNRGIIPVVGWTRNLTGVEECLAGIWFFFV
jgi:hypothetical protein